MQSTQNPYGGGSRSSTTPSTTDQYRWYRGANNTVYQNNTPVGSGSNFMLPGSSGSGGGSYIPGSGGAGGGAASGGYGVNGQDAMLAALQAQIDARNAAIDAANAALDRSADVARDRYNSSRKEVARNYQDLRNQASVQNFRARRTQREALADRGALNSGAGMQENIRLASNFNNNMNRIGSQENSAYEELLNNLNQYLADIEAQKAANMASGLNDFTSTISGLVNNMFTGYTPSQGYYDLASSLAGPTMLQNNVAQSDNAASRSARSIFDLLLGQR